MFQETIKLIIFVVVFSMPVVVARMFGSAGFLWLYFVSAVFLLISHNHYETLERINAFKDYNENNNEGDSAAGN